MSDYDSSIDSGETSESESGSDSIDITEADTEVDISLEDETEVDISGEDVEVEVDISSEEFGEEVDIGNETDVTDITESDENSDLEADVETDIETDVESDIAETDLELAEYLEKESPYSPEVNEYISSPEELQVYKDAGLVEKNVDGRICLIREDLDLDYVDQQSGLTNAELIAKGRSPYDAKTGERIELHHIGQDFNAPLAELQSVSEHDLHSKTLHKSEMDSWRRDPEKVSQYNAQRKAHWKNRA